VTSPYRHVLALAAGLVLASTPPAYAGDKVDRALREALAIGAPTQSVIISVNPGCRAGIRRAIEQHGDVIRSEHDLIDALSARIHTADVATLAQSSCVTAVSIDAPVHAVDGTSGTHGAVLEGFAALMPPTARNTLRDTLGLPHVASLDPSFPTGASGITAAIIDSGIQPNADFTGRIDGFWDFTRGGIAALPYDDYGHGTHIAGLIGSSGRLSNYEFQGVAPDIHLLALKVLDQQGAGKTSDVIKAIEFVVSNRAKLNAQIINLSLGHPIFAPPKDDPLVRAVEKATRAGIYVVVSAGNWGLKADGTVGYAGITSPGNAQSAITVGAAMTQDTVTRDDDGVAP